MLEKFAACQGDTSSMASALDSPCCQACVLTEGATYVDKGLLYLPVGWHRGAGILLPPHPGADCLQGAIRAAPPRVIKPVLCVRRGYTSIGGF